jgi:transcriptional regulator of aromatic amino acid metabolism
MAIQLQAPVARVSNDGNALSLSGLPPYLLRAEDDWLRAIVSQDRHLNVLVHCPDVPVASAIAEIGELCGRALWTCAVPGTLHLPDSHGGTVVIGDVSTLSLLQQIELYDWLDRFGESAQVLSFTSIPLWPLVERGRFLEGLFYRLNVVTLTADAIRH